MSKLIKLIMVLLFMTMTLVYGEDKVDKLERHVERLNMKMDQMMDSDEEIMDQHKKLFEALAKRETSPSTGYNY